MQSPTTGDGGLGPPQTTAGKMQSPTTGDRGLGTPQTTAGKMQSKNQGLQDASSEAASNLLMKSKFTCRDCGFTCNSFQNFRIHSQTANCKADGKAQKMSTINAEAEPENGEEKATKLKDFISLADREPLIGMEYLTEYRLKTKGNQIEIKYFCELCECNTDVEPTLEHLAGTGHRKRYLAKEYPYVLDAQAKSKEDPSVFIKRMAGEMEEEEGTKLYKSDPALRMEVMTTANKNMKKRTRWVDNKNDPTRMQDALKFLETFEVESETEATTISNLCEKMIANMKLYVDKAKEQALFSAKVAKAQDVAMSLTQMAARKPMLLLKGAKKGKPRIPPLFNRPPTLPENVNLVNQAGGIQSVYSGPNSQNRNAIPNMTMAPPYQQAQRYPSVLLNQQQSMQVPLMPLMKETPQTPDDPLLKNITPEDARFFKKLMALLEALPQSASSDETSELNSKLMMLKSLLVKEKNAAHEQANQKLMMQIASMAQNMLSAQNASVAQQLMRLMATRNRAAMAMPTGHPMSTDEVPGSLGTRPTNVNSLRPFNQSFEGQTFGQMGGNALRTMDQNSYQVPTQNYPGTSQNYDHFAFGNSVAENYVLQGNSYAGQHGGVDNPPTTRHNNQKFMPYTDVGYQSTAGDRPWDEYYGSSSTQVSEPRYDDYAERKAAYAMSLSPSSPRNWYENTSGEMRTQNPKPRRSLRSYDSFDWDDDGDMRYNKHPRLDEDTRSDTSGSYHTQSLQSLGIDTTGMPNELIKRLQGKDLFTAAAIVSEYSERCSGK